MDAGHMVIGSMAAIVVQVAPLAHIASVANAAVASAPPAMPAAPAAAAAANQPADDLLGAERLITQQRFDEASEVLEVLERKSSVGSATDNQVQFLLGLLDMHDRHYLAAISRFRRVLLSEPGAVRVRLEMGRAYFLAGRYSDAERQFMYARAGKNPKAVRANIDRYLGAVRQRKIFSFGFSISLAPDTNLNAGPATSAITLYGLPFQLDPDAKASSGVGLLLAGNMEWAPQLGTAVKWRIGTVFNRSQYCPTEFDDMTIGLYSGPHFSRRRWDLDLLGNVARRWYGDHGYAKTYGPSVDATYYINPRLGVGLAGSVSQIDYDRNQLQDGLGESLTLTSFFTPTTSSYLRGAVSFGSQAARIPAYAFTSTQFGVTYIVEISGGITAGIAPSFTILDYDAALDAFATIRRDRQYATQLSLLDRRLDFHGLTPRVAYTFIKNDSNIPFYAFNRSRFEIGITSSF